MTAKPVSIKSPKYKGIWTRISDIRTSDISFTV